MQKIIDAINKKEWWRTALPSVNELHKRGLFFASNYEDAEFYGRPLDEPFHVTIKNPYITSTSKLDKDVLGKEYTGEIEDRFKFDEDIKKERRIIQFPLPTVRGVKLMRIVPDFLFDYISSKELREK